MKAKLGQIAFFGIDLGFKVTITPSAYLIN